MSVGAPWSVQVELVEGCNRLCPFCGLNAIRKGPGNYKWMAWETAERTSRSLVDLCPTARLEFAMHGEPTMHPRKHEILAMFRERLPKAQMQLTTNGNVLAGKMQERLEAIFDAGVDFVLMDTYYPERLMLQAKAQALQGIQVLDFYRDCQPNGWSPYHNHHRSVQRTLVVMDDLGLRNGESRSRIVVNQAGNSPAVPETRAPLRRMCTLPFREVTVAWNGDVNLCCEDWGHEYTCGNVLEDSLRAIWWGEAFEAARRVLFARRRAMTPCCRCDKASGPRVGLVPKYDPPNKADLETIRVTQAASRPTNGRKAWFDPLLDGVLGTPDVGGPMAKGGQAWS